MNQELPDIQARFRKGRGTESKLPTLVWSWKRQENSRKTSTSTSLTTLKPLTVWITTNCGKFLKRWEYQTTLPASWETCMQVKKQQFEPYMEQWTGSKLGKEYIKAVYCHLDYLTYMQSISCKISSWMIHTADLYLCRRHTKIWLNLRGVSGSWCTQGFVWVAELTDWWFIVVVVQSLSYVQFFVTHGPQHVRLLCPWGFSRQEY